MHTSLRLAIVAAVCLALAGCDRLGALPFSGDGEVLTIRYWQAPTLPMPYLSRGDKDADAAAITLEPLANYDPDGNLAPKLAAEIPSVENGGVSQDLRSITWRLRDGLMWSDGSDMTADDVAFTWRYCADAQTGCASIDSFAGVASVTAEDNHTITIAFDAPTPYPYGVFVGATMPIISRAQFADCVGAAARTAACNEVNAAPLGTGPYRIVEFTAGEGAAYERNPFYRGDAPHFDRVVLRGGGDAADAARATMVTGEADFAWNLQIEPEALREMEANGLGTAHTAFASQVERIVVNQTNPDLELGDDRSEYLDGTNPHPFLTFTPIPQAMSMAIDRAAIAERLYGFAGMPTCNIVAAPARYASAANDDCLTQDIAAAKALLDANGVVDTDGDLVREYNGVPLRITYQTTANAIRQETQTLIRSWWRQIGIDADLVQHDAGVFFGGDPQQEDSSYLRFFADVQMYTDNSGVDPQRGLRAGLCDSIETRANAWASGNNARACNAEFDALFAELERTQPGAEREALVKRLNDIIVQNYYQIPLVNRGIVSATLNTLKGVRFNAWDSQLWNIAEWHRQ